MHAEIRTRKEGTLVGFLELAQNMLNLLQQARNRTAPVIRFTVPVILDRIKTSTADQVSTCPVVVDVTVHPMAWSDPDTGAATMHTMLAVDSTTLVRMRQSPSFTPMPGYKPEREGYRG